MSHHLPLVSIVILNWNCQQFLPQCIESVLKQTYHPIELILMDNASTDDSITWVKEHYPDLTVMQNDVNLGFAKAHNLGIRRTHGEYYMPLNPDVILTPTFVTEMVRGFKDDLTIGAVTGKVYFTDDHGRPSRKLYTTGHLLTKNRRPLNRGYKQIDEGQYEQSDYVFGVNGACPLFKREMLEDIAVDGEYFDETFFLYGDDYDLGWRAQLLGWKARYVPTATAYHHGKGSGGLDSPYIQFQYARNRYIEIYKNDLHCHFLLDFPYIVIYELVWQVYTLISDPNRFIQHIKAWFDFIAFYLKHIRSVRLYKHAVK